MKLLDQLRQGKGVAARAALSNYADRLAVEANDPFAPPSRVTKLRREIRKVRAMAEREA